MFHSNVRKIWGKKHIEKEPGSKPIKPPRVPVAGWTEEEKKKLFDLNAKGLGWRSIAEELPGRNWKECEIAYYQLCRGGVQNEPSYKQGFSSLPTPHQSCTTWPHDVPDQKDFWIAWDMPAYVKTELEGDSERLLENIFLTSSAQNQILAMPCKEYLVKTWPSTASEVIHFIASLDDHGNKDQNVQSSGNGLRLQENQHDSRYVCIRAKGTQSQVSSWLSQLQWLAAACRPLRACGPRWSCTYTGMVCEETYFSLAPMSPRMEITQGCWRTLFENMPVAFGFPTPNRPSGFNRFLELPFRLMTTLAGTKFPIEWNGGILLMGYSTILIPMRHCEGCIVWHLFASPCQNDQIHLDVLENEESSRVLDDANFSKTDDVRLLVRARTFLGFSPQVEINLGTMNSKYGSLCGSGAAIERRRLKLDGPTISLGSEGMGFFGCQASLNFRLSRALRANMRTVPLNEMDRLKRAAQQPIFLYDMDTKRGWFVPELSFVLHLLLAWGRRLPLESPVPFAEPAVEDGGSAFRTISDHATQIIERDLEGRSITLQNRISMFLDMFDQRKEAQLARLDERGRTFSWGRETLCGWDCGDIISLKMFPTRREVKLSRMTGWSAMLRKSPDILTVFCRGLGEAITTAVKDHLCLICQRPPEHLECVKCMEKIPSEVWSSAKLRWTSPDVGSAFQPCIYGHGSLKNRLHTISPGRNDEDIPHRGLQADGAVIFADPNKIPAQICTSNGMAPEAATQNGSTPIHTLKRKRKNNDALNVTETLSTEVHPEEVECNGSMKIPPTLI